MSQLNIVIPMAGAGSRFSSSGYIEPKPLIPIHGFPMIRWVIKNLTPLVPHRFIFICQISHIIDYDLIPKLKTWSPGCEVVGINGLTEGAACTVLAARNFIDNDEPLMIANSDQYIDVSINDYLEKINSETISGLIMTMTANDPKWSYVKLDNMNYVKNVVEKQVISNEATVGIYNFAHGSDFIRAANKMISMGLKFNNEYYVAPVYNQLIDEGSRVGIYNVGKEAGGMFGLGTPADLGLFLGLNLSKKLATTL